MATFIGLNLRAALGSVPPLLPPITDELGLSSTTQGMLTSVAILFTGLCAPVGQKLGARIGPERATAVMLGTLAVGCSIRLVADHTWVFLLSSAVAGVGMGGATALLPSLIAHHVPKIRGIAMGLYSTGLAMGVAVAAWIAVPTDAWLGGWKPALALWGLIALVTLALWLCATPRLRRAYPSREVTGLVVNHRLPWRSRTAWWVTWYTTAAMIIGFSGLAWVTPLYVELGVPDQRAAGYFVAFQVVQLAGMLTLPWLTDYTRDRRPLLALVLVSSAVGIACLLIDPLGLVWPAMCLFGTGAGGGSTLALVLLVDVASSQADAARLSGMVMLVAYVAGAFAPVLLGVLHDLTGAYTAGYSVILALILGVLVTIPAFRPDRRLENPALGHPASVSPSQGQSARR
ncbi:MFS transporter [Plantactinospora mayteni]|nr:MFS transporter [Plantactinospora mayteni]